MSQTMLPRALFIAGLALLALAAPPAAIVLAWPLLVVVPGWLLVARIVPQVPAPGRLGLGIVASVYLASHLVNAVAMVIGFGRPAVLAAAGLLALASWILARWPIRFLAPPPELSRSAVRRSLEDDRLAWGLAALIGGLVLFVLGASAWHQTPDGWVSGGWNWSDFLVHVAIGQSIVAGNFPPQVPYFAGAPLTYHWFADFHGAILAAAGGLSVIPVFIASSAGMAAALVLLVFELARALTKSGRVAAIAVLLAVLGGGMGWIRLVGDMMATGQDPWTLLAANPYDNTWAAGWPFFRIASVLGTGILTHRATAFGLPGFVAVLLLVHASLGKRPSGVLLAGVLAALLAPFQFYFFPATYLVVGLYVLTTGAWRERTAPRDAALFLAPLVLALPFVLGPIATQSAHGSFRFVLFWSQAPLADGPGAVLFFYVTNLGLPMLLGVAALLGRSLARPVRAFLAAWALATFLIPNLVVLSAVEFDMNKYFQLTDVALAIAAAALVARWPKAAIAAVLAFSMLSPAAISVWSLRSSTVALSAGQEQAAHWIAANTPERAVFVTDAFINSPVDLAGRLRLSTFGPYVSNLGYDASAREADIHAIYCGGDVAARALMARYGATYVLASGGVVDCGGNPQTDFDASRLFAPLYRDGFVAIWGVR